MYIYISCKHGYLIFVTPLVNDLFWVVLLFILYEFHRFKKQFLIVLVFAERTELYVEPLPEDKARRTLEKINLLSKIREEILPHPQLDDRLKLCQVSADVPDWWVPGKHDKDLLVGVAK